MDGTHSITTGSGYITKESEDTTTNLTIRNSTEEACNIYKSVELADPKISLVLPFMVIFALFYMFAALALHWHAVRSRNQELSQLIRRGSVVKYVTMMRIMPVICAWISVIDEAMMICCFALGDSAEHFARVAVASHTFAITLLTCCIYCQIRIRQRILLTSMFALAITNKFSTISIAFLPIPLIWYIFIGLYESIGTSVMLKNLRNCSIQETVTTLLADDIVKITLMFIIQGNLLIVHLIPMIKHRMRNKQVPATDEEIITVNLVNKGFRSTVALVCSVAPLTIFVRLFRGSLVFTQLATLGLKTVTLVSSAILFNDWKEVLLAFCRVGKNNENEDDIALSTVEYTNHSNRTSSTLEATHKFKTEV